MGFSSRSAVRKAQAASRDPSMAMSVFTSWEMHVPCHRLDGGVLTRRVMPWSIKLAEVRGIGVYVHATFFLLLIWAGLGAWEDDHTLAAVLDRTILLGAVFGIVVLHELGHAAAAQRYGVSTRDITLLPIGGVARMDRIPEVPSQELVIALAGPAVNVAIAVALYAGLSITGTLGTIDESTLVKGSLAQRLMLINVSLAMFNLLPAFPLDGGRALRALLATRLPYPQATRIAASAGQGIAVLLGMVGLMGNPMLVFIALFVWIGAEFEARMATASLVLGSIPVRRAMLTDFRTLTPDASLERAVELMLAGSQREFPVLEDGRVAGFLTQEGLIKALARSPSATVGTVMCRDFRPAAPEDMLSGVLSKLDHAPCRAIPVVEQDRLLGLLTPENLAEFLLIREAMGKVPTCSPS
jgi:Zn-dependent protease